MMLFLSIFKSSRYGAMTVVAASVLGYGAMSTVQAQAVVGLGAGIIPQYEGSKKYRAQVVPLLMYEDRDYFIAPKAGMPAAGIRYDLTDTWQLGFFGAYAEGRRSNKDNHLHGMKNISNHAAAGVFTQLKVEDWLFNASYHHALKDGYGGGVELGASYQLWKTAQSMFRVGTNLSWADKDAMQTNFGVTRSESQVTGGRLKRYNASSGLRSYSLYGAYNYHLSAKWIVHSAVGVKRLANEAADSPVVQRKASMFGSVGLGYSF